MSKISKYFIKYLKDYQERKIFGSMQFGVKAVSVDRHGKLHTGKPRTRQYDKFVFGTSMNCEMRDGWSDWFNLSGTSSKARITDLVFPVKHPWPDQVQTFDLRFIDLGFDDDESSATAYKFFEYMFMYMLHLLDAGNDIYLGNDIFLKRDTACIHRMNIDLLVDE